VGQCCCSCFFKNVAAAVFLKMLLQLFFKNVAVADLIVVSVDEVGGLQCCILPDFVHEEGENRTFGAPSYTSYTASYTT
jgi:hypothetical protein